MLPVMEDLILADRAAQSPPTFNLRDLLIFSTVCGVGLDTVPVPGIYDNTRSPYPNFLLYSILFYGLCIDVLNFYQDFSCLKFLKFQVTLVKRPFRRSIWKQHLLHFDLINPCRADFFS